MARHRRLFRAGSSFSEWPRGTGYKEAPSAGRLRTEGAFCRRVPQVLALREVVELPRLGCLDQCRDLAGQPADADGWKGAPLVAAP